MNISQKEEQYRRVARWLCEYCDQPQETLEAEKNQKKYSDWTYIFNAPQDIIEMLLDEGLLYLEGYPANDPRHQKVLRISKALLQDRTNG